jgi:hypothetical protein
MDIEVVVIISPSGMRGLVHALHFAEKANLKVVPYDVHVIIMY